MLELVISNFLEYIHIFNNLTNPFQHILYVAIALAISRDGSSGGCIRLAVITQQGVERIFTPGDKLPSKLQELIKGNIIIIIININYPLFTCRILAR